MREILFRGKSENDGQWAEGSLVITTIEPAGDAPIKHYHIEDMTIGVFPNEFQSGLSETVDPETVGQFTGLTDKNGKKIFEGDIIKLDDEEIRVIRYDDKCAGYYFDGDSCGLCVSRENERMVIGNIHDNPELLEVDSRGKN